MSTSPDFYILMLKREFDLRQNKNSKYSLRSYAKSLKLSPATLSLVLQGKRKIPATKLEYLASRLALSKSEKNYFFMSAQGFKKVIKNSFEVKDEDYGFLYEQWEYFVLLALFRLDSFESTAVWLSQKSSIPVKRVEVCLERMLSSGLILRDESGALVRSHDSLHFFSKAPSESVRAAHKATLLMAQDKLETEPVENRDYSFVNLALDEKSFLRLKKMIFKLKQDAIKLDEKSKKEKVVRLAIQCFSLTTEA